MEMVNFPGLAGSRVFPTLAAESWASLGTDVWACIYAQSTLLKFQVHRKFRIEQGYPFPFRGARLKK
jgi:hypothetical protein